MNELESLRRLTEAVETAKADIAPTYIEYVHLAFAIATDCGEEGRDFFHRLCRVSAKYQREHAERIFSNALTANHGDMHLGTVFYLAEAAGVTVRKEEVANSRTGTKGTAGTAQKLSAHTGTRVMPSPAATSPRATCSSRTSVIFSGVMPRSWKAAST